MKTNVASMLSGYLYSLREKLLQQKWIRSALHSAIDTPQDKQFIFVVGCYNSGTTLLDNVLASHVQISNLPTEGVSLTPELRSPEEYGWNRMWHMCKEQLEISRLRNEPSAERIKKDWSLWFDSKKEFWLEKSIVNGLNIDWLEREFDHPYFVWIVRDGCAVAEGIRRRTLPSGKHPRQYDDGYPIELCMKQWVVSNDIIGEKLSHVKNHLRISYEELTRSPDQTIKQILDWLPVSEKELEFPEDFAFHQERQKIDNLNRQSITRLSKDELAIISAKFGSDLLRYGYDKPEALS